jgi:hypothetical protein
MESRLRAEAGFHPMDSVSRMIMIQIMKPTLKTKNESGAIGWALLWLIGIPIPLLLIFFVLRGCT